MKEEMKNEMAYQLYCSLRFCKGAGMDFVTWRRMCFPDMPASHKRRLRGIWRDIRPQIYLHQPLDTQNDCSV